MNNLALKELEKYRLTLDVPEKCFDDLAMIAQHSINVPISGISIVDEHNIWLKARIGVDLSCLNREGAFCSHAVSSNTTNYIVEDTLLNPLYTSNPLVTNSGIRFYAASILRNENGFALGTVWVMDTKPRKLSEVDLTILNSLSSQASKLIEYRYTNSITGLPNHITFIDHLQTMINMQLVNGTNKLQLVPEGVGNKREEGIVGIIIVKNLDILENIVRERGGHLIQKCIARRLELVFSVRFLLAHLYTEKFAFALECTSFSDKEINHLVEALAEPIQIGSHRIGINCTVGTVGYPTNGVNASSLFSQALSMSKSLKISSNGVALGRCSLISDAQYIKEIHKDICESTFTLQPFYQPQVDVQTGQVIGLESLARWKSEKFGWVAPNDFIPLVENAGFIVELDLHIFTAVCRDMQCWRNSRAPQTPVSVNFSRLTLTSPNILEKVKEILKRFDMECELIKIEITESIMFDENDPIKDIVNSLHKMGFNISIDDFGTGFSNLATLRLLEFDQLKVDKQFIEGIAKSRYTADLFSFIRNIASLFSSSLMCEGVENIEDIDYLITQNCRYMQGWYFSKALPESRIVELLSDVKRFSISANEYDFQGLSQVLSRFQ